MTEEQKDQPETPGDRRDDGPRSVWIFVVGIALVAAAFYFGTRRDPKAELAKLEWPEPLEAGYVLRWHAAVTPTRTVTFDVTRDGTTEVLTARYETTDPAVVINVPELDPLVLEELRRELLELNACGLPAGEQISEQVRHTLSLRLPELRCELQRTREGWDEQPYSRIRHVVAALHQRGYF